MSISETWYAIKDHGTNYCNLYNLMEGKIRQQYGDETTDSLLVTIHTVLYSYASSVYLFLLSFVEQEVV